MEVEELWVIFQQLFEFLTSREGNLYSVFDKTDRIEVDNISVKQKLNKNHTNAGNKRKLTWQLPLEHIFGFCRTFKKVSKGFGFHMKFKMADSQDIIYTTTGSNFDLTTNSLSLFVPTFIPDPQTLKMFNDSFKKRSSLSFDSWTTLRQVASSGFELQVDIGSETEPLSPNYLGLAHQTTARKSTTEKKTSKIANLHTLYIRNFFVENDEVRFPQNSVFIVHTGNDRLDQHRDPK